MPEYKVTLLPAQKEFIEVPDTVKPGEKDVCIYQGGYGSGKTWVGSLLGCMLALRYPGIIGLIGAQTYTLVRDTTLREYKNHLTQLGIKYSYNEKEACLKLPNGSILLFRHFDDPECYKSLTVGFAEIEEASQISLAAFKEILARARQPIKPEWGKNFIYRIYGHTNPQGNKGWIYELFKKKPLKNYRRVIAPTTENIHLPKDFVDGLRDLYSKEEYAIRVLGNDDDNISNLVVKGYEPDKQLSEALSINPNFPIHLTCDFNVDPMCWYICQNYNDMTYILHEVVLENVVTDTAASFVADLLRNYKTHKIIINGDATGNSLTTKGADYKVITNRFYTEGFRNIELKLMRKNPNIEWRLACFNNRMKAPDGSHKILIHPQCIRLIYNFENLELKAGTNKPKLPSGRQIQSDSRLKYLGHPIDAVSYLIAYYYPIKDETPWKEYQGKAVNMATDIFGGKYDSRLM